MGVPDLKFINRQVPIAEVARALDLRFGENGNIHCWRGELHQNGDRTASIGIRKTNNTIKCFGCDIGPLGPIDLVMAVLGLKTPGPAAQWIAERFNVPEQPDRKHLRQPERRIFQFGNESEIGVLVYSGLWARLSPSARSLVPVLLELADREPSTQSYRIQSSYQAISRFAGISSPNAIAGALRELQDIHWLLMLPRKREPGLGPVRESSNYLLTPRSDQLLELANANCAQMRDEVEIQRKKAAFRSESKRMLTK
jgi:hypothetical protein